MIYDLKKIKEDAKKDFFSAWKATAGAYPQPSEAFKEKLLKPGQGVPHPIPNMIAKIRGNFLRLGFKEVENQLFIEESDVYKQYGPEAPAILDRCYYLGGLPRPEIGLSDAKVAQIKKFVPGFDAAKTDALKDILRDYKLGRIEGDDFLETIKTKLSITTEQSTNILSAFDELKNLKAEPTKTTLRSHMTAAWFPTIAAIQDKSEHPIKLFSTGLRFRREQKIDATHLRAHYGASCIVCDENMEIEAGKALAQEIMKPLGFKDFEYVKKAATSTYYANDSEYEVYAASAGKKVEIADVGMYSPIALAAYDIKYPVFNAGFGVERMIMIKENFSDVREVMYPQFYQSVELTDAEIAKAIGIDKKPQTEDGKKLSHAIEATALKHGETDSPCSFEAFNGKFLGKHIAVRAFEKESGTKLLGPAAWNDIYVCNGSIYGIPPSGFKEKAAEIKEKGLKTGISYMRAMSDFFAAGIEEAVNGGALKAGQPYTHQFKMAKTAPDINIKVADHALQFIQAKRKELMLKGPLFLEVEATLV